MPHGAPYGLADSVTVIPRPAPRPVTLSGIQVARLAALAAPWLRLFILLCHDCALRSSTAARVSWRHIQGTLDSAELVIVTKGASVARVPISGRLAQLLAVCPKGDGPLIALLRGKAVGHCTCRKHFRELLAEAEIAPGVRPHDLRRSMAESAYNVSSDIRVVQRLLGHTSLFSTVHYLQRPAQATQTQLATTMNEVTNVKG